MKAQINYGLEGAFKVDLYSGDRMMESTDWFKNFITHTGLSYPSVYPFVDCFRYLSIGYSAGFNTPNSGFTSTDQIHHTTGLASPVPSYLTTSGAQRGTYLGWEGYEVGSDGQESPCGTILTEQGPAFFRAWSIPTGDIGITMNEPGGSLQIGEFMVSPSSGTDPTGKYAFSRITRNLSIPNGWRAIVSYQLRLRLLNTGRTSFGTGTFATGNADVTNDPDLVSGWYNLSGYYRQVYHGLMCVDKRGNSFVPRYGAIMEPSLTDLKQAAFYLSPDNSAFDVNGKYGGAQSDETTAYNSDGLMKQLYVHGIPLTYDGPDGFDQLTHADKQTYYFASSDDPSKIQADFPSSAKYPTPFNIRLGDSDRGIDIPSVKNYSIDNGVDLGTSYNYQTFQDASNKEISYATPGKFGIDQTKADYGEKAVFSTRVFKLPVSMPTGRKKTQTRRTMFAPVSSLGTNTRFGSLIAAYRASDSTINYPQKLFYPMVDTIFYNSEGRSMMPHYRLIPYVYLTERGTGVANAYITLFTNGTGMASGKENIQRLWHRQTFQGPYNGGYDDGIDRTHPCFTADVDDPPATTRFAAYLMTGSGINPNVQGDISFNTDGSGWGALYGVVANSGFYNAPYDIGLIDHNISALTIPVNSAAIYWPTITSANQIKLSITGILFYSGGSVYRDNPAASNAVIQGSGFCRPTGYVYHVENIGSSGFRLLPNHGVPNNSGVNTYTPQTGGYYPGLSFDNGLDLYFDISWNSDCGTALNCNNAA
jgi:hypothetical protein